MNMIYVLLCVGACFVGAAFGTEADIKAWFLEKAIECSQEHTVNSEEMKMLKDHKFPESNTAKCLLACVFKKAEWIDDKGMFNEDNAYKLSLKEFPDDKEKLANAKKLFGLCKTVNDENFEDGAKGCERASLLASCLVKNAGQSGFLLQ
ncbi:general odorant-binding protein 19d-like [Pieris rapae]|uniref:general odorant-binding protein 19d-like n=1 Tax=Pieris rapae TaxID=64459 RepID=UPI001E280C59|nr:general odorant-binding protein 19d-like [Pieris rapae]